MTCLYNSLILDIEELVALLIEQVVQVLWMKVIHKSHLKKFGHQWLPFKTDLKSVSLKSLGTHSVGSFI